MEEKSKDNPGVIAPPPLIYLAFLIIGFVINFIWPVKIIPDVVQYSAGFVLIVFGIIIMSIGLKQFRKAGTCHKTYKPTRVIMTNGLFKYSRNPLYSSLSLGYVGIGIAADNIWILVLFIPLLIVMHYGIIFREERYLKKKFGDEYLQYKSKVRRWL